MSYNIHGGIGVDGQLDIERVAAPSKVVPRMSSGYKKCTATSAREQASSTKPRGWSIAWTCSWVSAVLISPTSDHLPVVVDVVWPPER